MAHSERQDDTPGEILRSAREASGVSPREMADRLNWMPTYLVAIEENRFEVLRGTAFARGYLRAYAKQLKLDESGLLAAFDNLQTPQVESSNEEADSNEQSVLRQPAVGIGIGLSCALLLIVGLWWGQGSEPRKPAAVTNVSQGSSIQGVQDQAAADEALLIAAEQAAVAGAMLQQAAVEEAYTESGLDLDEPGDPGQADSESGVEDVAEYVAEDVAEDTLPESVQMESGLVDDGQDTAPVETVFDTATNEAILQFRFSGDCWVEVRDGNDQLIYADLRLDGDSLNLDGQPPFNILVGDARFVELQYQGEPFVITPRPGRVIARFSVGAQ